MEKGGSGELEMKEETGTRFNTEKGRTRSRKRDWRGEKGIRGERMGAIQGERRRWRDATDCIAA